MATYRQSNCLPLVLRFTNIWLLQPQPQSRFYIFGSSQDVSFIVQNTAHGTRHTEKGNRGTLEIATWGYFLKGLLFSEVGRAAHPNPIVLLSGGFALAKRVPCAANGYKIFGKFFFLEDTPPPTSGVQERNKVLYDSHR